MLTPMSLKYTFSELLSLPEDVLVQHLVKVKDENGNIVLQTADNPELAPIADQDVVREKLLSASKKVYGISFVDPNSLSNRLFELVQTTKFPSVTERIPEDSHRIRQRTTSPPPVRRKPDQEIVAFEELTQLGGRPACSIESFQTVRGNPHKYLGILDPWQPQLTSGHQSDSEIKLFSEQLSRWKLFRAWQHKSRGIDPPPNVSDFQVSSSLNQDLLTGDEIEDYTMKEAHTRYQILLISKCIKAEKANYASGLSGYSDEAQSRLRRHKIHRLFSPSADPTGQTKLNTWLEYIAFETWWLDTHTWMCSLENGSLEQESDHPKDYEIVQAHECYHNEDSLQRSETLSGTSDPDDDAALRQATQKIAKDEMDRSQRIVDWTLIELENVEIEPQPESERPKLRRRGTSPLTSPLKKRKRNGQTGSLSPEPITPAPSFPNDRRADEAIRKRRRTTSGTGRVVDRDALSDLSRRLSPATSPKPTDDKDEEGE